MVQAQHQTTREDEWPFGSFGRNSKVMLPEALKLIDRPLQNRVVGR